MQATALTSRTEVSDVPDAVAPPPRHPRYPLLDGMRAIAVLCVVVVHVAVFAAPGTVPLPRALLHLNLGVTIFFLISGFLLYRPFIAHRGGGAAAPAIDSYAKRRALRIFPAYWLILTVLTVLPGTIGVSGGEWLGQYALMQTLPFASESGGCTQSVGCGLSQTWSLVVELGFYIVLPLWFIFSGRLARGRSTRGWVGVELACLATASVLSVALHFSGSTQGVNSYVGGTVLGFFLWFALGMGLAVVSVALEGRSPRAITLIGAHPGPIWLAALGIYAILCAALPASPFLFESGQQLWTHLAFALIALLMMIPAVFADEAAGLPRRILAIPAVAWLGLISYGIFLWHYVVTVELGNQGDGLGFWPLLGATLAISLAAATASYYAVERPLLRFKYARGSAGERHAAPRRSGSSAG